MSSGEIISHAMIHGTTEIIDAEAGVTAGLLQRFEKVYRGSHLMVCTVSDVHSEVLAS